MARPPHQHKEKRHLLTSVEVPLPALVKERVGPRGGAGALSWGRAHGEMSGSLNNIVIQISLDGSGCVNKGER